MFTVYKMCPRALVSQSVIKAFEGPGSHFCVHLQQPRSQNKVRPSLVTPGTGIEILHTSNLQWKNKILRSRKKVRSKLAKGIRYLAVYTLAASVRSRKTE